MITTKKIVFSENNTEADVILNVNDVTKYLKGYRGVCVYILDVDMYIKSVGERNIENIDKEIKSPLRMLFLGDDISEWELLDKLSRDAISLHDVINKLNFDYLSQISEDGYRYIKNEL